MPPKMRDQRLGLLIEKFRIVGELKLFDHSKSDTVRPQNFNLAFYSR